MKEGLNWWKIVSIVVVVSVLASLLTVEMTGNVISVARGRAGRVYTVEEVDALISNAIANSNRDSVGDSNRYSNQEIDDKIKSLAICPSLDFNCDGRITHEDSKIITDYWQNGTKIEMNVAINKCKPLTSFLAPYWRQNINDGYIPMRDAVKVVHDVTICNRLGVEYV